MGENVWNQPEPIWEFKNEGKEIHQGENSAPGIAIGSALLAGVDFQGTLFVGYHEPLDNDFIGLYGAEISEEDFIHVFNKYGIE